MWWNLIQHQTSLSNRLSRHIWRQTHLHMLWEEERAHNLLEADHLPGKLKHNTQPCISGHHMGGRNLVGEVYRQVYMAGRKGSGERDKNYNGKSRVNREMLKSRNNHENEERLCTEWLWCSVLDYTAELGMIGLWFFQLFSWMQGGLVPSYACLWLLLSVLWLIWNTVNGDSEYLRKFIENNWLQQSPMMTYTDCQYQFSEEFWYSN